jgi:hypothetical protein
MTTRAPITMSGSAWGDFWLVGGLSILVWFILLISTPLITEIWAVSRHTGNIVAVVTTAALLINYPHFMASYRLAYGQGHRFVVCHWWQLIVVPILLLGSFGLAWFFWSQDPLGSWSASLNSVSSSIHGPSILALLIKIMFFSVGWHYSKQTFGIMMVYARIKSYPLSTLQRMVTKLAVYGIWILSYVHFTAMGTEQNYYGIIYTNWELPEWAKMLPLTFFGLGLAGFLSIVLIKNGLEQKIWPPLMFVLPILAFLVWWTPQITYNKFFYYMVPLFHSLQYLCFVRKVEVTKSKSPTMPWTVIFGLIFWGWFGFELLPSLLDHRVSPARVENVAFFFICANLFLNIHHYFIDNVVWRSGTSKVPSYLFAD